MKKKFIMSTVLVWASLFGIFSLSAAGNRVEVVSESHAIRELNDNGLVLNNNINLEKSDLVNGNVAIEITVDNSKKTEVIYVLDNGASMSSSKNSVIDIFKTNALELENMDNITQGIVTTTDGNITEIELDSSNIESQLESIKNISSASSNGEIFTSIDRAAGSFSESAKEKIIVIALSSMPTDISGLKTKIDNYISSGIKVIAYGINVNNSTNFKSVFDSASKYELSSSTLSDIKFAATITSLLPKERPALAVSISFDNYILNNFDINTNDIQATSGVAHYDASTNEVIWEIGKVKPNEIVKLNYVLSLKKYVDPNFIGKTLRTNRQIKIIQSGVVDASPKDNEIEDRVCSPTIRILQEAVDNPKTGVVSYVVFGGCLLAVSAITLVILNRKSQFSRI